MRCYEKYLEDQIALKDKIIETLESENREYKKYIETQLNCKIKETVESSLSFDSKGPCQSVFKIIEIPRSRFIVKLEDKPYIVGKHD